MNALFGLMLVAGVLYGILYDGTFWKIYGILVTLWLVYVLWARDSRENPKRKTILAASWSCKFFQINLCANILVDKLFLTNNV